MTIQISNGVKIKFLFIFLILILIFSFVPDFFCLLAQEKEASKRALEIVYPDIPGMPTPKYTATTLPDYINYIFRISILVIGLVIFGVLIYSGFNYLTSFGSPEKLSDAKKGIFSAFLGGAILLCAYLIFNTINPQLVILEPAKIDILEPRIVPGIYICNYRAEGIEKILNDYTDGDSKTQLDAVKKFKEKVGTPKSKEICFLVTGSGNLVNVDIKSGKYTIFAIPTERYDPNFVGPVLPGKTIGQTWDYEYGIIFHEKDNYGGKCRLLPELQKVGPAAEENFLIYHQFENFHPTITFDVKSITLFKKPAISIPEIAEGVTLYEGAYFNQIGKEEEEEETTTTKFWPLSLMAFAQEKDPKLAVKSFKPFGNAEVRLVTEQRLREVVPQDAKKQHPGLYHNTRSIEIEPKSSYFAILIGDDEKKCEVRWKDDVNLTDNPIGRCGNKCTVLGKINFFTIGGCYPCLEKMYVVEGQTL